MYRTFARSFILICLLGVVLAASGHAQLPAEVDSVGDSLKRMLARAEADTQRVKLLQSLGLHYRFSNMKLSEDYIRQSLALGRKTGYARGVAAALRRLGALHQMKGEYNIELDCYLEALSIFESLKDSNGISDCYLSIGNLYSNINLFDRALESHRRSLQIRHSLKLEREEAACLNNIGNVYLSTQRYDSARFYFEQALEINQRTNNGLWMATNLANLGIVFTFTKEFDKAIEFQQQALRLRDSLNYPLQAGFSQVYLGQTYLAMGRLKEAEQKFLAGLAEGKRGQPKLQQISAEGLAECYEKLGDYRNALFYLKMKQSLNDSLSGPKVAGAIAEAQIRYDNEQKARAKELEASLALQKLENEKQSEQLRQRQLLWALLAGAGVLLLLVAFLIYRNRARRRNQEMLEATVEQRTRQLRTANEEMARFIYHSSHDMRSPITSLMGLMNLALNEAENPRQYLELMMNRVQHLVGVNTGLLEFMNVKERVFTPAAVEVKAAVEAAMDKVTERRQGANPEWQLAVPQEARLNTDKFLLEVILVNLLTNAVDFRKPAGPLMIRVSAEQSRGSTVIRVEDNGTGIEPAARDHIFEMFRRGSNQSKGTGLGLFTAKTAAEKMNAQLRLAHTSEQGTVFELWADETAGRD